MAANNEWLMLQHLLRIEPPWVVRKHEFQPAKSQLDVWIGLPVERGWLGSVKAQVGEVERGHWWHLNTGNWRTCIHWVATPAQAKLQQGWFQQPAVPFSFDLARLVASMMSCGLDPSAISRLTGIPAAEQWKLRHALDSKQTHIEGVDIAPAQHAHPAVVPSAVGDGGASEVPAESDPVWLELLQRNVPLDIRSLSLKLLLTPMQWEINEHPDAKWRATKVHELHQYFEKNARKLRYELTQLQSKGA